MEQTRSTILIVEDDAAIRETLAELLEDEGFRAAVASDGRAALDWLRHNPAPGAILLDLMMPVMNGWDFRREQLADPALSEVPVVLVSGAADVTDHAQALQVAAAIRKPIRLDLLLRTLQELAGPLRDCDRRQRIDAGWA